MYSSMSVKVATQNVNGGRVSTWRQSFVETAGGFVRRRDDAFGMEVNGSRFKINQ